MINFENISVELALNVLQLKHNKYNEMTQQDMIQYYNEKIKGLIKLCHVNEFL